MRVKEHYEVVTHEVMEDLIITKVKDITMYKTKCSNCGWKNSLEVMAHYCPKCGKDLKAMVFTDNSNMSESSECIGSVDLIK